MSLDRRRLLGLLPIVFFGNTLWTYVGEGHVSNALWVCNVANLLLAAGLLFERPKLTWIATIWLIAGTPFWILHGVLSGQFYLHSVFTHLVSPFLGLAAMQRLPAPGHLLGWSLLGIVLLNLGSWSVTDPQLNVNFSHSVYSPMRPWFTHYAMFAAFMLGSSLLLHLVIEAALRWSSHRLGRTGQPRQTSPTSDVRTG